MNKEKIAKNWIVINPDGVESEVFNMVEFCKENSLVPDKMYKIARGSLKTHRGWTCKKL